MTDDLYDRLRAADPLREAVPVEPADSPRTRAMMEAAMSTETSPSTASSPRSRWVPAGIAASAAAVILAGALLIPDMLGDDPAAPPVAALELTMPGTDPSMASCIPLSAAELGRMPIAFAGTATAISDETVTLDVDTWYQGGDAASVELSNPAGAPVALLGYGIDFEVGTRYLIASAGETVNLCGFSGEATPELQAIFDEAFAG